MRRAAAHLCGDLRGAGSGWGARALSPTGDRFLQYRLYALSREGGLRGEGPPASASSLGRRRAERGGPPLCNVRLRLPRQKRVRRTAVFSRPPQSANLGLPT